MEQKTQNQGKNKCNEVEKYIHCMEKELEYWLKEKKISYMERAIRSMDINTRFAGTVYLGNLDLCWYPDDPEVMDMMYEDDEDLVYEIVDEVDFEEEDDEIIAG